ncbi:VOC family protein [Paenarthrobacter sp. PH39-S1]|uniref:VOC family protein n=1 Tax=Paenarthrobacter sp. PH39-S1 TaxID=3046204 RepID=UPI0024BBB705|nr:VOC family protein [Paenarthrobacter sp. PH39-S1]MDJ0358402.1 glyoxalase [Paenarthrobacter sp. PH39-S1]
MNDDSKGALHHIELWIPNLERAKDEWGWILSRLGYENYQNWSNGISWRWGPTYIVAEESLDLSSRDHQRTAPGLNHLAFNAGSREDVDALAGESAYHGWSQLFADKCTNAGGREHYAAYLMKSGGFELELVATV